VADTVGRHHWGKSVLDPKDLSGTLFAVLFGAQDAGASFETAWGAAVQAAPMVTPESRRELVEADLERRRNVYESIYYQDQATAAAAQSQ
jgi:hypothetical protein